jgi:hypothetical protein
MILIEWILAGVQAFKQFKADYVGACFDLVCSKGGLEKFLYIRAL